MNMSNIEVAPAKKIKPQFYTNTIKDIKNVLKSQTYNFRKVTVDDDYDRTENIVVIIQHGQFTTYGCEDGKPWTEAYDAPKLFAQMEKIGFTPSFFQVDKIKKEERINPEEKRCLNIGFIKKVPKSQAINYP